MGNEIINSHNPYILSENELKIYKEMNKMFNSLKQEQADHLIESYELLKKEYLSLKETCKITVKG